MSLSLFVCVIVQPCGNLQVLRFREEWIRCQFMQNVEVISSKLNKRQQLQDTRHVYQVKKLVRDAKQIL